MCVCVMWELRISLVKSTPFLAFVIWEISKSEMGGRKTATHRWGYCPDNQGNQGDRVLNNQIRAI